MALQRKSRIALALLGGVGVLAFIGWMQREPIARSVIDDQLSQADVKASYTLQGLSTSTQRITDIRLGDPVRPDLTADWAEVETVWSFWGPRISGIRAGGVRLNARFADGQISLGALDKLLPEPDGTPFTLPGTRLWLSDARLHLDTPYGTLGAALSGSGRPDNDFVGQLALAAPSSRIGGCSVGTTQFAGAISTTGGRPRLAGPLTMAGAECGAVRTGAGRIDLDAALDEALKQMSLSGDFALSAPRSGSVSAQAAKGKLQLGGALDNLSGDYQLQLTRLTSSGVRAAGAALQGRLALAQGPDGLRIESGGTLAGRNVVADSSLTRSMTGSAAGLADSPVGPLVQALEKSLRGLDRGSMLSANYDVRHQGGSGSLAMSGVTLRSLSGARLTMAGDSPIRVTWPDGALRVTGSALLDGGGFPRIAARFGGTPGMITGVATVSRWQAGTANLALTPVRFRWDGRALALQTKATLDGPLGNGRITGLSLPVSLSPGAPLLTGCHTPSFQSVTLDSLQLGPTAIRACISGDAVNAPDVRIAGRMGTSPLSLTARNARLSLANGGFRLDEVNATLGAGQDASRLSAASLTGLTSGGHANGSFGGLSASIGAVPVLLDEGAGRWSFAGGNLSANGAINISDSAEEKRYFPFNSQDFSLSIHNGQVNAHGTLRNPKRQVDVAQIFIRHSLSGGSGQADIVVPGLTFGQAIQPEEITPITLGVIANVDGVLKGKGQINWSPTGVTSSGTFGTDMMDMAAAFGPVAGLSTQISFSDLLGLETPPGQQVRMMAVNPGVAVLDGLVSFRLLPGLKAQIEGGRWPFAGGYLVLEPAILDLNQAAERRLTFRVEGLDAARFIAAMEFENIAASGTFDGVLPMVFDAQGGRIEGGSLVARSGGTLSYVGEISNENLGMMGRFAFDALKSLRYNRLSIELDGAIDGDVVTRIKFAGVNQAPISGVRATLPIPIKVTGLTNIPFIFNVTITAKFRQLFEMARSFNDPSVLINRMIPELQPVPGEKARPVQPPERPERP
jgi:hypothetical protein